MARKSAADRRREQQVAAEWEAQREAERRAERARWRKGEEAAAELTAAGYPAKALYDSVILDADVAQRMLALARVPEPV